MVSVGRQLGVKTPTLASLIHIASLVHSCDFWANGRTVERVGLSGLSVKEIRRLALEGVAK